MTEGRLNFLMNQAFEVHTISGGDGWLVVGNGEPNPRYGNDFPMRILHLAGYAGNGLPLSNFQYAKYPDEARATFSHLGPISNNERSELAEYIREKCDGDWRNHVDMVQMKLEDDNHPLTVFLA